MTTQQDDSTSADQPSADPDQRRFLGHPAGLLPLFNIELWERFSFYGLQVILAYYLYYGVTDGGLGLDQGVALGITGSYGGLVYLSQMLGAWVADRVLAPKVLVLVSGTLITAGHVALAVLADVPGLVVGLALIVLGTGGLKVNVTSMVSHLYPRSDIRRDAGFALYYMGISIGAFLGPLVTGPLQTGLGFHAAFAAAAIGMVIGLVAYVLGGKGLAPRSRQVANPLTSHSRRAAVGIALGAVAVLATVLATGLVTVENIGQILTAVVVVAAIAYFAVLLRSPTISPAEKRNVRLYIPVFLATLLFWTLLFQLFTTFAVYADTRVDLSVGPIELPAAYVVTAEGVLATVVAPILAATWTRLGTRQPATPNKIALGLAVMVLPFLLFAALSGSSGPVNNLWLVVVGMLLFAVAEIAVVPAAMSIATSLAPRRFPTQMISLYFLTMAGGSTLSGLVSQLYSPDRELLFFGTIAVGTLAFVGVFLAILRRMSADHVVVP